MTRKVDGKKDGKEEMGRDGQERTPRELIFVCPVCGGHDIVERIKDKRRIRVFADGRFEFSDPDGWDKYNCVCLCGDCGSIIRHETLVYFKDRSHLGKWLSQEPEWELQESTELHKETYINMSALINSSEKKSLPGELRFVCLECPGNEIDECWVTETPIKLYEDGFVELGCPDYDEDAHHYRCRRCQTVLEDEWGMIDDNERLVAYLKDHAVDAV